MEWYEAEGLTFDDVLIRPGYSELNSRLEPDLSIDLIITDRKFKVMPIICANMSTLATTEMIGTLGKIGIIVPAHRNQSIDDEIDSLDLNSSTRCPVAASVGLTKTQEGTDRLKELIPLVDILFLELAHAHSKAAYEEIKHIRELGFNKLLVVGNVCTYAACRCLIDAGADVVKCGTGNGAVCLTRLVTGCGVPQFSAITECSKFPIIADGGIRYSGDAVKALAAGAKFVMIGSLFAGTDEANPEYIYSGMASREANEPREGIVPEGISVQVPRKGPVTRVARDLLAGIRQGLAMVGARNLQHLREVAEFQRVSSATAIENQPHIRFRRD
jgi:IMP dehydrogenase